MNIKTDYELRFKSIEALRKGMALIKHLELEFEDIERLDLQQSDHVYFPNYFTIGEDEYLILTDEEADERAETEIRESLWAFNASYIVKFMKGDYEDNKAVIEGIKSIQEKCCENANEFIYQLIKDEFDEFVAEAVLCDGRGHFLSMYDSQEHEVIINNTPYFIYKQ